MKHCKSLFLLINFFAVCFAEHTNIENLVEKHSTLKTEENENGNFNDEFTKPYIVISLGAGCIVAIFTRQWGLRENAFPVDWVISPFEGLFKLFQNNFENYFNKENLQIGGIAHPGNIGVYDTKYDIHSRHDFMEGVDFWSQYADIKKKYDKRVARLYRALNSNKKIYFIRTHISQKQTLTLAEFLTKQFPKLDYELIVVNDTPEFKQKWNLNKIHNYFLTHQEMSSDQMAWKAVFCDIGLLK